MAGKNPFLKVLVRVVIASAPLLAVGLPARTQSPESNSQPSVRPPEDNTPREIIYPYYSLREGTESNLQMMDRAPKPIEFTVAIHGMSGRTVWAKPRTIGPEEELNLDIRKILRDLSADTRGDFSEGSVSLHFKGKGNPLGGRMAVVSKNGSWNLGPVWKENESGGSMIPERLDTFWWELGGSRDAEIVVDNTTSGIVAADLYLDFKGKRHAAPTLRLGAYEMKHLSVTQILAQMGLSAYEAPMGGVSIVSHTSEPVLVARGNITDSDTGRMNGLPFPLPQMQFISALHTTALPISVPPLDSPFAGTGNFVPHVLVRNLLDSEQTLTLTVEYPGENGPQQTALEPIRLAGYTTQDIRLDSYYNRLPLPLSYVALRIQYNGPPGALIGQVTTVDDKTGKVEVMGATNEGDGYAGSLASYWSFDEKSDFYLFFTNMGEEVCHVALDVDTRGVHYFAPVLTVSAHETTHVNLRDLRDKQLPDGMGHTIPPHATEGRLFYNRMDNVPLYGRVMELPQRK